MKKEIIGFSKYYYLNEKIFKKEDSTEIYMLKNRKAFLMKNDENKYKQLGINKLKYLTGEQLEYPNDAKKIYGFEDYIIDKNGNIYSYSNKNKYGKILKTSIGTSGYPSVSLLKNGIIYKRDVHLLVANTFILNNYTKHGLCCMHNDDNKLNYKLSNLRVGTYSKNNKDAYKSELIKSKKNSFEHGLIIIMK